jgi:hypothetical protein
MNMLLLYFPKHQPWDNPFPLGMRIVGSIAYIMPVACFVTIEHIIGTACNVDGIYETVFSKGIGEVPEGFFVASSDVVELIIDTANRATLYLAVQEETARYFSVADEDELAEE